MDLLEAKIAEIKNIELIYIFTTDSILKDKMNEDTVKVLTIHTAKGLEADNVVVIGARFRDIEERCVSYVAATRARNLLVWTESNKNKRPKAAYWGG